MGPTGSGKSRLALEVARQVGGEIISCDSVQVYRGFDIGSAKPTPAEQTLVPHHLIDVVDCHEDYDAQKFADDARRAIALVHSRGRLPIVAGGTGLYLRALLTDRWGSDLPQSSELRERLRLWDKTKLWEFLWRIDPIRAWQVHPNDTFRVVRALEVSLLTGKKFGEAAQPAERPAEFDTYTVIIEPDRKLLHKRIKARVQEMLAAGLEDEVRGLLARGCAATCKPMQSIGYRQAAQVMAGTLGSNDIEDHIVFATRQYAKRQGTWFRRLDSQLKISGPEESQQLHKKLNEFLSCLNPKRPIATTKV